MAKAKQPKRKPAETPGPRKVKTSLILDADLHIKLAAYAAMRGMDRNAVACEILSEALGSIVVFDRNNRVKSSGVADLSDEVDRVEAA